MNRNWNRKRKPTKTIEETLDEMSRKIELLEFRIEQLMVLVDHDIAPFIYYTMEANMTRDQVEQFYNLMETVERRIDSDRPMSYLEFESVFYAIAPQKRGDYSFARGLVVGLREQGMYKDAYDHLRQSGMNIP